jgi:hypothetical protein
MESLYINFILSYIFMFHQIAGQNLNIVTCMSVDGVWIGNWIY